MSAANVPEVRNSWACSKKSMLLSTNSWYSSVNGTVHPLTRCFRNILLFSVIESSGKIPIVLKWSRILACKSGLDNIWETWKATEVKKQFPSPVILSTSRPHWVATELIFSSTTFTLVSCWNSTVGGTLSWCPSVEYADSSKNVFSFPYNLAHELWRSA